MQQILLLNQVQGVHPRQEIYHLEHMQQSMKEMQQHQQCRLQPVQQEDHQVIPMELLLNQQHYCDLEEEGEMFQLGTEI